MSFFRDIAEGFTNGIMQSAGNGFRPSPALGNAVNRIEACCAQLVWDIDERTDEGGIALYFRDPVVNMRKVYIHAGDNGKLALFTAFSAAQMLPQNIPAELMGYLLVRNWESLFLTWQMGNEGSGRATFVVSYCALMEGLTPEMLKTICAAICKEVAEFDAKMRSAGLL